MSDFVSIQCMLSICSGCTLKDCGCECHKLKESGRDTDGKKV